LYELLDRVEIATCLAGRPEVVHVGGDSRISNVDGISDNATSFIAWRESSGYFVAEWFKVDVQIDRSEEFGCDLDVSAVLGILQRDDKPVVGIR